MEDRLRSRRAAGHVDVHRHDAIHAADGGVGPFGEDAAAAPAGADRDDDARIGRRVVACAGARSPCCASPARSRAARPHAAGSRPCGCRSARGRRADWPWPRSRARSRCSFRRRPGARAASARSGPGCARAAPRPTRPGSAPAAPPADGTSPRPVSASTSKDAAHASCSRVCAATSTSCETAMACSGHAVDAVADTGCTRRSDSDTRLHARARGAAA